MNKLEIYWEVFCGGMIVGFIVGILVGKVL